MGRGVLNMGKDMWELRYEGKESGLRDVIRSFECEREALEYVNHARGELEIALGEPLNLWLYHFKKLGVKHY
jgi:hypothetical protein